MWVKFLIGIIKLVYRDCGIGWGIEFNFVINFNKIEWVVIVDVNFCLKYFVKCGVC